MTQNVETGRKSFTEVAQKLFFTLGAIVLSIHLTSILPFNFRQVFVVMFSAVVLSAAMSPVVQLLERIRVPRAIGILIIYLALLSLLVGAAAMIVPIVVDIVQAFAQQVPQLTVMLKDFIAHHAPQIASQISTDAVGAEVSAVLSQAVTYLTGLIGSLLSTSLNILVGLVLAAFMTAQRDFLGTIVRRFVPPAQRDRVSSRLTSILHRISSWARAQVLYAIGFGVSFGAGLYFSGVKYALTLAVTAIVLELIPYIGGALVLILALLVALTQSFGLALFVLIWYLVVVQILAHVVYPKVVGLMIGLPPLAVITALFIGGEALGVLGALLAIPLALVVQSCLDEFWTFEELSNQAESQSQTST